MSNSIVFLDVVSPRGHVSINRFYLKSFPNYKTKLIISNELEESYSDICEVEIFNGKFLKKGRVIHSVFTLMVSLRMLFTHALKKNYTFVLLSYDVTNLFIISFFANFIRGKLIVYEHNTTPGDSLLKKTLQKLCFNKVLRICFSDDIKNEYKRIHQKAIVINHPIVREKDKIGVSSYLKKLVKQYDKIVFCPSANADLSRLTHYCNLYPDYLFIVKSKEKISSKNCYANQFFDEYNWIMNIASFVYLPINITGRVSGPLYGAIYHSCKVIVNRNDFGRFCHIHFAGLVQYDDETWSPNNIEFNVCLYNDLIIKKLQKFFLYGV